jgi:hypothetical protein
VSDGARLRERFLRDGPIRQLGNIASNLLRISRWVQMDRDPDAVTAVLRETAEMIDWAGTNATVELVDIHRELCRWRRIWPLPAARGLLTFRAAHMSDRVLELSGLAKDSPLEG